MTEPVVALTPIEPGIVEIRMQDRVHKNVFTEPLVRGLIDAFDRVRADTTCKVVVLTGYDTYFASGGSKEALLALYEGKAKFTDGNIYSLPLECDVPVIAAMQGHGIGGGFVLGLFADFVVLSRESVYTTNFMKYGFTPGFGSTYVLPKKLGVSCAAELLITARNFRGGELAQRGIPFPVLPRTEVLAHAYETARQVAEKPRESLIVLKRHLVIEIKRELPKFIEQELAMHDVTFHQPEVKERIHALFGL